MYCMITGITTRPIFYNSYTTQSLPVHNINLQSSDTDIGQPATDPPQHPARSWLAIGTTVGAVLAGDILQEKLLTPEKIKKYKSIKALNTIAPILGLGGLSLVAGILIRSAYDIAMNNTPADDTSKSKKPAWTLQKLGLVGLSGAAGFTIHSMFMTPNKLKKSKFLHFVHGTSTRVGFGIPFILAGLLAQDLYERSLNG